MKGTLDTYFSAYRYLNNYKQASLFAYLYQHSEFPYNDGYSRVTSKMLLDELKIDVKQIKSLLKRLKKMGLINYELLGANDHTSIYFEINESKVKEIL